MDLTKIQTTATLLFALAILHTFLCTRVHRLSRRFREGTLSRNLLTLLGEVEVVFGFWAAILIIALFICCGKNTAISYLETRNFDEPLFVFVIMVVAATKPIIELARKLIFISARILPMKREWSLYFACLTLGPLMGSLITEPAAMTLTALVLREIYYNQNPSRKFKYFTLALLFVNISIGGALTPFAAPPILMVARKWGWTLPILLSKVGWKAAIATVLNAGLGVLVLGRELSRSKNHAQGPVFDKEGNRANSSTHIRSRIPVWLTTIHILTLILIVISVHHPAIFSSLFVFFIGLTSISREHQEEIRLRQSFMVALFLGGLVILGGMQEWWLTPLITDLSAFPLFLSTTALTAITDNAALTYLGSLVPTLSEAQRYFLVSGAIAGGGLTVIANAPNPIGFSILQEYFGKDGIEPWSLFIWAIIPTGIVMACLWFLLGI